MKLSNKLLESSNVVPTNFIGVQRSDQLNVFQGEYATRNVLLHSRHNNLIIIYTGKI